ncbi:D-2-hydroxyacid dehydrogenase [Verticiella sediminum]|uniref:D-2-hydroxyacid dehydrogenase n=1 Tax=Verticiella sediminum TaxID=1247510 RepID=A0A556AJH3_9BURK|nr:D-2-hydroxyacid dehydrogenase [Verticiella sediminum]TSH93023.1 D-2-hydroxyacid dehydrogenase [Verticiella sediminum]
MPGILLSQPIIDVYGDQVLAALPAGMSMQLVTNSAARPLDDATRDSLEVAFLSVDQIGPHACNGNGKDLPAFFDTLLAAPNLRWLHICSAGTDRPQLAQLAQRGVVVTHSSGANAAAVAHVAMAGMLALARDVPMWVRAQAEHRWQTQRHEASPLDIDGTTAVVLGLGEIGRRIAKACRALDMHVIGVRRRAQADPCCDRVVATAALRDVVREAQWLFVACPLSDETRNLVDGEILALMPREGRLVNVGRGGVVDERDLLAALRAGDIAGAYMDVFATEPLPPDSPLWDAPNLLVSAHSAGASRGFGPRTAARFIDNLHRWSRGQALKDVATFPG